MQYFTLLETDFKRFETQFNMANLTSVVRLAHCNATLIININLHPHSGENSDRSSSPEALECETT